MGIGNTFQDLTGRKYGNLTVLGLADRRNRQLYWFCECSCGVKKQVRGPHLRKGKVVSCGCSKTRKRCTVSVASQAVLGKYTQVYRYYWHSARRRGLAFALELSAFLNLITTPCAYCGSEPSNTIRSNGVHYSGIDRVDNNLGYVDGNVLPACKLCNVIKNTLTHSEFLAHIELIHSHQQKAVCEVL